MTSTDWRIYDTPEAHSAFCEAQTRLDERELRADGDGYTTLGVEHYTREMIEADEKLTDRYDRLVNQPAHAEFEQQCEDAEFDSQWPEPPDESRIEFEANRGIRYAAYRMDVPERQGGTWWLFGDDDRPRTWRELVVEFEIWAGPEVELLVSADDVPVAGDGTELAAEIEQLRDLLADTVVKATEFGTQEGGFVAHYILPTGPIHRAMPYLEQRGIVVRPGFDGRKHGEARPDDV